MEYRIADRGLLTNPIPVTIMAKGLGLKGRRRVSAPVRRQVEVKLMHQFGPPITPYIDLAVCGHCFVSIRR